MKLKAITVGLVGLCLGVINCSSQLYISHWASPEALIDGQRKEWKGLFQVLEKENFAIAVAHDANYLYVAITSIHAAFSRQVAHYGLTIWLDPDGKNRQSLGISFPGQQTKAGHSHRAFHHLKSGPTEFHIAGDMDLTLRDTRTGLREVPPDLLATVGSEDPGLFIEYQIPLTLLRDSRKLKKLSLGLTTQHERHRGIESRVSSIQGPDRGNRTS